MKSLSTLFLMPLAMCTVAVLTVILGGSSDYGLLGMGLTVVVALGAVFVVAHVMNFAVFAPIYWLLGRLNSKKSPLPAEVPKDKEVH